MKARIGILGAVVALAAVAVAAQPYRSARALSAEFLTRLASHGLKPSQVAVINVSVGAVVVFDRNEPASVVFIHGAEGFVWSEIARQLSESATEEQPMHVTLAHRSIDLASCPAIVERLAEFRGQLEAFDPKAPRTVTPELQEIIVDATDFRIITAAQDAVVAIQPNGPLDPPLQQAAGRLHSIVSRCAGSVTPQVQRHFF